MARPTDHTCLRKGMAQSHHWNPCGMPLHTVSGCPMKGIARAHEVHTLKTTISFLTLIGPSPGAPAAGSSAAVEVKHEQS
jgi:hypothetical protein